MKVTSIPTVIGVSGTVTKGLLKGLENGLGCGRTSRDYPDYRIVENGQNTETSPGELKRLAVAQAPVKNHQLEMM